MRIDSESSCDLDLGTPSGVVLSLFLREKLKHGRSAQENRDTPTHSQTSDDRISPDPVGRSNTIFTAKELQDQMWRASVALVEIQKQLHRGEESYHEETHSHGNLFRGFDAFIDAKDVGTGAAGGNVPPFGGFGGRRMPADHRWFSGSCPSVGRHKKPQPHAAPTMTSTKFTHPSMMPPSSLRSEEAEFMKRDRPMNPSTEVQSRWGEVSAPEQKQPIPMETEPSSLGNTLSQKSEGALAPKSGVVPGDPSLGMGTNTETADQKKSEMSANAEVDDASARTETGTRRTTRKRKAGD